MGKQEHWQAVYTKKLFTEVSWYRPHLEQSLALIATCGLGPTARIVDVGGGASTLAEDLLERGHTDVTVLDLSAAAFEQAKLRLGDRAASIHWIVGDATTSLLEPNSVDLWHDRAVFHFQTEEDHRAAYLEQVTRCVRVGGYALIATFSLDGPERCSGLPVTRYAPDEIAAKLGPRFEKVAEAYELHQTPGGSPQAFCYALCRRIE